MKAVYKLRGEPGAVEVRSASQPEPGPEEILVKVGAGAICGSDIHIWHYARGFEYIKPPLILGHEFVGTIVGKGAEVTDFQVGDRVISEAVHYCGRCLPCRLGQTNICENFRIIGIHFDGGFAEYAKLKAHYAHKVPASLDDQNAALVEPVTVAVHAVYANADFGPKDVVLVTGSGPIGLLVAQAARTRGTDRIIVTGLDSDEEKRLSAARALGFRAVNIQRETLRDVVMEMSDGHGADVAFEASGSTRAFVENIDLLRKGGRMVIIGYPSQNAEIFATPIIRKEITLQGNISGQWKHFEMAIELMTRGRIKTDFLITRFGLEDALPALEAAAGRDVLKAVLVP